MKELLQEHKDTKVEIVVEKQQKKEIKLIGRQRKIQGLTLWEFNNKSKELKKAEFKKEDVMINSLRQSPEALTKISKVIVNENCIYFQALNIKNAKRKLGL